MTMAGNERKIKVLWIDDQPSDTFLDIADNNGLDVEVRTTVQAGLNELQNKNQIYEAIILDANCKIADDNTETPQLIALANAIVGIYAKRIDLPWFVYTGGTYEGKEALEHIIPQNLQWWESKQWYNKPDDINILFEDIKKAVEKREESKIIAQYSRAFNILRSQDLLKLLKSMNTPEFERDEEVPHTIRCLCEELIDFLEKNSLFYRSKKESSNLTADCSRFFSKDRKKRYTPIYIQRLFHFLSEYANAGSHESTNDEGEAIRKDIKAGNATFLNRTATLALMNIILWCSNFPLENQEKMKDIQMFYYNLSTQQ